MKNIPAWLAFTLVAITSAAAGFGGAWASMGRYTLLHADGPMVYRMDRMTGEVYFISGTRHGLAMPAFYNDASSQH